MTASATALTSPRWPRRRCRRARPRRATRSRRHEHAGPSSPPAADDSRYDAFREHRRTPVIYDEFRIILLYATLDMRR